MSTASAVLIALVSQLGFAVVVAFTAPREWTPARSAWAARTGALILGFGVAYSLGAFR